MAPDRKSLIEPLESDHAAQLGWRVELNGRPVADVRSLVLRSDRFGEVHYGRTPAGYDSWSFIEPHGGVVIVPFVIHEGTPMIGVVEELRYNLGGWILNCPRGFVDAGETAEQAALREFREEVGREVSSCFALPGAPCNPNSAFFETPQKDMGVAFYAIEILAEACQPIGDELTLIGPQTERSMPGETIGHLRFIDWRKAVQLRDMFTLAGVARLLSYLDSAR